MLALLASGPLLLTEPLRGHRQGRVLYALAVAVSIVCGLWAGSLYANGVGESDAAYIATHPTTTVTVYSVQSLKMADGSDYADRGNFYHYKYSGLIVIYMNTSTYYLLAPPGTQQWPQVFVLDPSDETRIAIS